MGVTKMENKTHEETLKEWAKINEIGKLERKMSYYIRPKPKTILKLLLLHGTEAESKRYAQLSGLELKA
jgi:hypothetical protein